MTLRAAVPAPIMGMELSLVSNLAIALGLGLLVGMERERAESRLAGIRTFPLITLLGVLCAALAQRFGGWILGAALAGVAALLVTGNLIKLRAGEPDPGMTTESAALLMFGVGAALAVGWTAPAIVLGGGVAVLLHWKRPLHGLVRRFGADEFRAIMRLVLIALVILPLLPNCTYGPYGVLNPFEIWLMVVLIVGLSLAEYVALLLLGPRGGTVLAGRAGPPSSSAPFMPAYSSPSRSPANT